MRLLDGKIALVTGAGQGLAKGSALALAQQGASIVCVDRNRSTVEQTVSEFESAGFPSLAVQCDVSVRADVDAAVTSAVDHFGGLDILVNCAMTQRLVPFEMSTEDDLLDAYRSSVLGTYNFMMASFPHLKERGGKVVNFGSAAETNGEAFMGTYAAAKGAVRGMSKSVASEWGQYGINVNVVCPTGVSPAWEAHAAQIGADGVEKALAPYIIKRMGDPVTDIGGIVVFLASALSDYMTARTLFADGGGGYFR